MYAFFTLVLVARIYTVPRDRLEKKQNIERPIEIFVNWPKHSFCYSRENTTTKKLKDTTYHTLR